MDRKKAFNDAEVAVIVKEMSKHVSSLGHSLASIRLGANSLVKAVHKAKYVPLDFVMNFGFLGSFAERFFGNLVALLIIGASFQYIILRLVPVVVQYCLE
jgi:hypothetical protein